MDAVSGNLVDVRGGCVYPATVEIEAGRIARIRREHGKFDNYLLPGFIDAHIHIESSMLTPSEFARIATVHGTVATVSDPHEIANVLGEKGVEFMISDGKRTNFKFYFGAPSCVPATTFETNGATLGAKEVTSLLRKKEILYLSEVMNYPGVIARDSEVMAKITAAKTLRKRVDGHAPGVRGAELKKYAAAGITTDHESFAYDEALDKLGNGMKIQIREGSAAKNFEALYPLIEKYPKMCMFCSDDRHPDDLLEGHINLLVKRAVAKGVGLFKILRCACVNPVEHYGLDVGLLREGDSADFIVVDNLRDFNVLRTYVRGQIVAERGKPLLRRVKSSKPNKFRARKKSKSELAVHNTLNVMAVTDGQLVDKAMVVSIRELVRHEIKIDPKTDVLKIVVVNRYADSRPAVAFAKNFGLKKGAIASSVAHDSHNIIAVGVNDELICKAINCLIRHRGGICAVDERSEHVLPLPIAGVMSDGDFASVAEKYSELDGIAKSYGSKLRAPFMTLSFMALPVIPQLKLTDKGLFDVTNFRFVNLFNM
ncbi:Adenine deaminase [Candidatus Norongarragalina meridionalis]|nr:Adenine deaminase [Candidatus Norongarragalina meridionalis]